MSGLWYLPLKAVCTYLWALFTANVLETFKHHSTVDVKGSFKDDVALLGPTLPTPKTPASFAYRLDSKEGGKYEWMMITFVPDDAGVCLQLTAMDTTDV
jgi:hypothetical protein